MLLLLRHVTHVTHHIGKRCEYSSSVASCGVLKLSATESHDSSLFHKNILGKLVFKTWTLSNHIELALQVLFNVAVSKCLTTGLLKLEYFLQNLWRIVPQGLAGEWLMLNVQQSRGHRRRLRPCSLISEKKTTDEEKRKYTITEPRSGTASPPLHSCCSPMGIRNT